MALVQSAHGGNEADDAALCTRLASDLFHPRYGADYFHDLWKRMPLRELPHGEFASCREASCLGLRSSALAVKEDQVRRSRLGFELTQQGGDLAAMIGAVVHEVLQHLPQRSRLRDARSCFVGRDAVEIFLIERGDRVQQITLDFSPAATDRFECGEISCRRVLIGRTTVPAFEPQPLNEHNVSESIAH